MDSLNVKDRERRPSSLHIAPEPETCKKAKVAPRVITGPANIHNQGAIDWGENGLLAYGCNYTVVVVDTKNVQPIQSLDKHKSMVNKVLWGRGQHKTLVSADTNGHIVIWGFPKGNSKAVLQDGKNAITSMAWMAGYDEGEHLLLTLHPPYALILWDTNKHTKLWKKTYTENLVSFDLNPFQHNKMAFQCTDCILFVEDLTPSKIPSSNGRKFYVSTTKPSTNTRSSSSGNLSSGGSGEEKQGTRDRLRRLMRDLAVGETKPKAEDSVAVTECLQLVHHRSLRNLLLLVYPSEVLLLDLHINHTVGLIPLERSTSPLLQVVPVRQRDILYCLHESGSVSVRFRRQQPSFTVTPLDAPSGSIGSLAEAGMMSNDSYLEVSYEQRCQSEVIRQTKGSKIIGIACSPICERRIALFINTGKIVFLELQPSNVGSEWFTSLMANSGNMRNDWPKDTISDMIPPLISDAVVTPVRLLLAGLLPAITSPLTAMRMSPGPCETKHAIRSLSGPLLAAGTSSGLVQIINVASGTVEKEIAVCSYPVRGIEWIDQYSFITWSYPNTSSASTTVRNELCVTNILTGFVQHLRQDRGDESSIEIVRVSPLKVYFVVVQKDATLELWDLQTLNLLKSVSKKFTSITALEWSRIHVKKAVKKKASDDREDRRMSQASVATTPVSDVVGAFGSASISAIPETDEEKENTVICEHFALTDADSNFYHFTVEGNVARDGIKVVPEPGRGTFTCLAFKGEKIVQGDSEGNINVCDLKTRKYYNVPTGRGAIKKMSFAPGEGNLKLLLLFADGALLLNLNESLEHAVELRCPRDMVRIVDIDWAAEDFPLLATQDGCLRVMDSGLKNCSSPLSEYEFQDPVSCISLLPKSVRANLQIILASRYWETESETTIKDAPSSWEQLTAEDGFTEPQLSAVQEQLALLDNGVLSVLSKPGGTMGVAERSLLVSRLLGDQFDVDFWTVALYYLQFTREEMKHRSTKSDQPAADVFNLGLGSPSSLDTKRVNKYPNIPLLDTNYDILCDSYIYQKMQMDRVALYESKRGDYQHTKRVIQELILLGETDRAVQLLLETELENPSYYTDAIKACLVATIQSTGAAQSTIKLVATNLIANGTIWEGVQLLCLIGKGLDACRYLLSYGLWDSAVWLAKSVLPPGEMHEVMKKWADHLFATGHKHQALLVTLSMGGLERTLELLGAFRLHKQAGLLLQACREFGILPQRSAMSPSAPQTALLNAVELDFARCLFKAGNHRAAMGVCKKLGEGGSELMREFEILAAERM